MELAVEKALEQLGTGREQVSVEVLQKPQRSLFGLISVLAEVRVTLRDSATVYSQELESPTQKAASLVWVSGGALQCRLAAEDGTPPAVIIKPPVQAKFRGEEAAGRVELDAGLDALELELPVSEDPCRDLQVVVSDNGLTAQLEGTLKPGRSFSLRDHPPTSVLELMVDEVEMPALPFTRDEIQQLVLSEGLKHGVDLSAVTDALLEESAFSIEIAHGEPPVEAVDEDVKLLFECDPTEPEETEERVDHYERNALKNVEQGDCLARKTPSVPGREGIDVFGRPIPVSDPKTVEWALGDGVELSADGTEAYAARPGMPVIQNGVLQVLQVYEVAGDADLSTGHIRFKGQIVIRGSVAEKIEVQADAGGVQVLGMVSGASIEADEDIVVQKTAVSSNLHAGGMNVIYLRLLSYLHSLSSQIEDLIGGLYLLRRQTDSSDGKLLKTLLELKFKGIPTETQELASYLSTQGQKVTVDFHALVRELQSVFLGRAPLNVQSVSQVSALLDAVNDWVERLEEETRETSNVTVKYLQNCQVEASGWVKVTGQGCYYSSVVAGTGLHVERGVFRGGDVVVDSGPIRVKELGGPTGVGTAATVVRSGTIVIGKAYANASVCIGSQRFRFDGEYSRVKAYRENDRLVVVSGHRELT